MHHSAPPYFSFVAHDLLDSNLRRSLNWSKWGTYMACSISRGLFLIEISEVINLRYSNGDFGLLVKFDSLVAGCNLIKNDPKVFEKIQQSVTRRLNESNLEEVISNIHCRLCNFTCTFFKYCNCREFY